MARITAGVATSHVPAIGAAVDQGKTREDYWRPVFAGYEFIKHKGADEVRAKIEKGNQDAIRKGIDARMSLDECIDAGGVYDFGRQRCTAATLGPR